MPKLWNDTVQEHRDAVREAVLDGVARLVAEGGASSVSMTRAAEGAGISRATLYKYFSDVQALLLAWHERQIGEHLGHLHHVRDQAGHYVAGTGQHDEHDGHGTDPVATVRAVLEAYALMLQQSSMDRAPGYLHAGPHTDRAHAHLHEFLAEVISDATASADGHELSTVSVRNDVPVDDLVSFALHAVNAAAIARSPEAARLLVGVVVDGLLRHPDHLHDLDHPRN
ncbi:TetR/AcrR family transcriptional regulator [Arthrobacter sp. TMS2-4]